MVEALLCTCIDFRFVRFYPQFMEQLGLRGRYDQVSLAGASLTFSGIPSESHKKTVMDQVKAAGELHQIQRVIVVDHEQCGAYSMFLGAHFLKDPLAEKEIHSTYLKKAKAKILTIYPDLIVELYHVTLAGEFEKIT